MILSQMVSCRVDTPAPIHGGVHIIKSAAADIKIVVVSGAVFVFVFVFVGFTEDEEGMSRVAGSSIFTFQKVKRGHSMAATGESLA